MNKSTEMYIEQRVIDMSNTKLSSNEIRPLSKGITFTTCPKEPDVAHIHNDVNQFCIPHLHLALPGLRQNYPRQFGHGRASLPIYTGSANRALLANYPIYIYLYECTFIHVHLILYFI